MGVRERGEERGGRGRCEGEKEKKVGWEGERGGRGEG